MPGKVSRQVQTSVLLLQITPLGQEQGGRLKYGATRTLAPVPAATVSPPVHSQALPIPGTDLRVLALRGSKERKLCPEIGEPRNSLQRWHIPCSLSAPPCCWQTSPIHDSMLPCRTGCAPLLSSTRAPAGTTTSQESACEMRAGLGLPEKRA